MSEKIKEACFEYLEGKMNCRHVDTENRSNLKGKIKVFKEKKKKGGTKEIFQRGQKKIKRERNEKTKE